MVKDAERGLRSAVAICIACGVEKDLLRSRAARKQRLESSTVERSLLVRIQKNDVEGRTTWQRFPFVDVSAAERRGILPTQVHGTRVLVDRHCTGLEPHDGSRPRFYLIQAGRLIVGRVTPVNDRVIIRRCDGKCELSTLQAVTRAALPGSHRGASVPIPR